MCQLDRKNVTYLLEYDIIKIIKIGWCQYKMKNKFAELDIGLISFVSNIKEYQRNGELKKYLETGNQKKGEWNLAEEVVRLLTLASTESFQTSPTECLIINLENNKLSNIPSKFFQSMLKGDDSFEKEYDYYLSNGCFKSITSSLESYNKGNDDSISNLLGQIQEYYEQSLDKKIQSSEIDVRQYEPLLDIFINQTEEVKESSKGVVYGTNKKGY